MFEKFTGAHRCKIEFLFFSFVIIISVGPFVGRQKKTKFSSEKFAIMTLTISSKAQRNLAKHEGFKIMLRDQRTVRDRLRC